MADLDGKVAVVLGCSASGGTGRAIAEGLAEADAKVVVAARSEGPPIGAYFPYPCARAGTDCIIRYAATEYGLRGIRVNSVLPGPIRSDMARHLFETPGVEEIFRREVPPGRIGDRQWTQYSGMWRNSADPRVTAG